MVYKNVHKSQTVQKGTWGCIDDKNKKTKTPAK
jgi:hypothetical protein